METKKTKEATYTKEQFINTVADVLNEVIIKLKDPSLVIVGMVVMNILNRTLK